MSENNNNDDVINSNSNEYWQFIKGFLPFAIILIALDFYYFDMRFAAMQPSPFWLLVLIFAPRHGAICGLISGLTACAAYFWNLIALGHTWEELLHQQPGNLVLPCMFLLTGVYLGSLFEDYSKKSKNLEESNKSFAKRLEINEMKRAKMEDDRVNLEKRIACQKDTLLALNNSIAKLANATTEKGLLQTLCDIVLSESKAQSCGVWTIKNDRPELLAGNGEFPDLALSINRNNKLIFDNDICALVFENKAERIILTLSDIPFINKTRNLAIHIGLLTERAGVSLEMLRNNEALLMCDKEVVEV